MPNMHGDLVWYELATSNADDAQSAIKAAGGQMSSGPDEIRGGEFALMASDPQRAAFGLVVTRKGDPK